MSRTALLVASLALMLAACSGESTTTSRPPRGNPQGVVTVKEYADLQCPACKAAHTRIAAPLLAKYGSEIRYDFKHFPLRSIHRYALDAAEMSECAADQGKFWEFVDVAFEKQENLDFDALLLWIKELGLDSSAAEKCWKSHSKRGVVLADYKEGRALEVAGTPSFFVNGERVETGFDTVSAAIEAVLKNTVMRL